MMAERHPDELDLLDLVEDELPGAAQASVTAHVEACAECAETVRQLRAGRGALHASGVLQLSDRARDSITEAIDREAPVRSRRARYWEPRRLGLVLAMTLVLVASVVAVAQWGGVGDEQGARGDAALEMADEGAGSDDAGGGAEESAATAVPESTRVAGPARAVASDLRAEGFDARVVDGEVVVRLELRASAEEPSPEEQRLQDVLAERPAGDVVVRVEP